MDSRVFAETAINGFKKWEQTAITDQTEASHIITTWHPVAIGALLQYFKNLNHNDAHIKTVLENEDLPHSKTWKEKITKESIYIPLEMRLFPNVNNTQKRTTLDQYLGSFFYGQYQQNPTEDCLNYACQFHHFYALNKRLEKNRDRIIEESKAGDISETTQATFLQDAEDYAHYYLGLGCGQAMLICWDVGNTLINWSRQRNVSEEVGDGQASAIPFFKEAYKCYLRFEDILTDEQLLRDAEMIIQQVCQGQTLQAFFNTNKFKETLARFAKDSAPYLPRAEINEAVRQVNQEWQQYRP